METTFAVVQLPLQLVIDPIAGLAQAGLGLAAMLTVIFWVSTIVRHRHDGEGGDMPGGQS